MGRYSPINDWSNRKKTVNENGYVLVWVPEHPKSFGGWYYEHRLWGERKMGRILNRWETVHHISENKQDNSDENLFICTRKQHDYARWLTPAIA